MKGIIIIQHDKDGGMVVLIERVPFLGCPRCGLNLDPKIDVPERSYHYALLMDS